MLTETDRHSLFWKGATREQMGNLDKTATLRMAESDGEDNVNQPFAKAHCCRKRMDINKKLGKAICASRRKKQNQMSERGYISVHTMKNYKGATAMRKKQENRRWVHTTGEAHQGCHPPW